MKKSELRTLYTEKRKSLAEDEVFSLSQQILLQFINKFKPTADQNVHCFIPIIEKKEVDTKLFFNYFFENKIRIFVPRIVNDHIISVEILPDTPLIKGIYGIYEPMSNIDSEEQQFDFIIMPLLYCDDKGSRIGYGKGFYDRFLAQTESTSIKIGVNFFGPNEKITDISEHDVPLDYLVTPTEVLSF